MGTSVACYNRAWRPGAPGNTHAKRKKELSHTRLGIIRAFDGSQGSSGTAQQLSSSALYMTPPWGKQVYCTVCFTRVTDHYANLDNYGTSSLTSVHSVNYTLCDTPFVRTPRGLKPPRPWWVLNPPFGS